MDSIESIIDSIIDELSLGNSGILGILSKNVLRGSYRAARRAIVGLTLYYYI